MSQKPSLLILIGDLPFPARKNGISIRYFPIIEKASSEFDIDLVCICDYPICDQDLIEAKKYVTNVAVHVRQPKPVTLFKKILTRFKSLIPNSLPHALVHYDQPEIEAFLKHHLDHKSYDSALCVLLRYHHLFDKYVRATKKSLDLIDSPYATELRKTSEPSPLASYDLNQLKSWEQSQIQLSNHACYISPLDRDICWNDNPSKNISIFPNGLFLNDKTEDRLTTNKFTIGYLGHMGYPPNIKAALRLARIFRDNKNNFPDTQLLIIGRSPSAEILALKSEDITVTGSVDNIWPYINSTDVFCFPMEIGSGQQNKLLEAMAAGIPVISTTLGNSGIGAVDHQSILLANTDEEIANAISLIYSSTELKQKIGEKGQLFVTQHYSWDAIYADFRMALLKKD